MLRVMIPFSTMIASNSIRSISSVSIPSSMRAVLVQGGTGPASALHIGEAPTPTLKNSAEDILVKVKAFGINRMDILQRLGKYPIPPGASPIIGVEFSGEVVDAGNNVKSVTVGDSVFGLATGGAYAEYIRVPASMVLCKPTELSWEQAASVPEAYLTAFQALTLLAPLQKDEDVLVHAGASGVGVAAIQLARLLGARNIYVTAGSQGKIDFCRQLGATQGFNYKECNWKDELLHATGDAGVDVILDFIGAAYFAQNLAALKRDGRLSLQGLMGGLKADNVNLGIFLMKRLRVEGSTLRSRSLKYQSDLVQSFLKSGALDAIVRGTQGETGPDTIQLMIHHVYDWADIAKAHEDMAANKNSGKLIATIEA